MNDAPQELHRLLDTAFAAELHPALRRAAGLRLRQELEALDRHLADEQDLRRRDNSP